MASSFAFLRDAKPYKISWKVQVRVLHTWKTYTTQFGEIFDMALADMQGTKIHASVKKDLINRFENKITPGQWKTIENFGLSLTSGQFKPTNHRYKLGFITQTIVLIMDSLSNDPYLTLSSFDSILSRNLNPNFLVDVVGQVVNVGQMDTIDVNNKPTKKIDFELRDTSDVRLPCTLWASFAEQLFIACEQAGDDMVICLVRFAKIKLYKDVRSISNAFNTSKVAFNPEYSEIVEFKNNLPNDSLALTILESKPRRAVNLAVSGDFYLQFPKKTIKEVFDMIEFGRVMVSCTIYAIDTDWACYYIACRKCNKKVTKVNSLTNGNIINPRKPQFWCECVECKSLMFL